MKTISLEICQKTEFQFVGRWLQHDDELVKFKLDLLKSWDKLVAGLALITDLHPTEEIINKHLFTLVFEKKW
jgi:hypothetical protein